MLIASPNLQKPYIEFYSCDPALVQVPPLSDDASSEERDAHAELVTAHARKLQRARETGDWSELLIGGERPTAFKLRPLAGDQYRTLLGLGVGGLEMFQLAFRCALVEVENFGKKSKPTRHPRLGVIAGAEICNELDAITPDIVNELGALVMQRADEGLPKK